MSSSDQAAEVEEDRSSTNTNTTAAAGATMKPSQSYSSYSKGPVIRSPKLLTLGSCSKDPCGIICMFITYSAVFYADYVVTKWIVMTTFVSLWGTFHVVVFNIIVGLLLMAHLRAVFTDPGFVTNKYFPEGDYNKPLPKSPSTGGGMDSQSNENYDGNQPDEFQITIPPHYTLCPRCNIYRPPRAHHCRICKKCTRRMDHHCPWVNNCVGEFNQKYFIQFLFYVGLLSAYAIGLVLYTWVESSQTDGHERTRMHYSYKGLHEQFGHFPNSNNPSPSDSNMESKPISNESHLIKQTRILHSVILMLESLLFGLFVLAILIDQFSAIFTDETVVEQHISGRTKSSSRTERRPKRSKTELLRDVCGKGHFALWILPCHTRDDLVYEKPINEIV